jgi:DNA-binding response OmpR family regulator
VTSLVLVVEDDPDIALAISTVLGRGGFDVARAADGKAALREFHERRPSLVVLDIGLPLMDGWEVLDRIRDMSDTPVLVLSAHGYETDKVRGLRAGADDYLAKPFGNAELLVRSQALLRRVGQPGRRADEPDGQRDRYDDGFLRLDQRTCEARVNGQPVALTPTEFRLLTALVQHAGQVLSPPQLLELAWNDPGRIGPERVKFSIMRLRRKLGPGSQDGSPIEAVRGFGYRYARPRENVT